MSALHPDIAAVLEGRARWAVLDSDNRPILASLPIGAVDHTVCDPPYDQRTHERARSLKGGGSDIPINFAHLESFAFVADLLRVSQRWVIAFCAVEDLGRYSDAAGDAWVRAAIWHRTDGTPQLSGDRPAQAAEGIAVMHGPGKKRWNGGGLRGLWSYGVDRTDRLHPTPKPLPLMLELISLFTDEGDLVIDPYCGSGTTGVACLRLGRRFIGCDSGAHPETGQRYAAIARERLEAEVQGLTLRDARAGQLSLLGGA